MPEKRAKRPRDERSRVIHAINTLPPFEPLLPSGPKTWLVTMWPCGGQLNHRDYSLEWHVLVSNRGAVVVTWVIPARNQKPYTQSDEMDWQEGFFSLIL